MQNKMFRKGLVFIIILLFIGSGMATIPETNISGGYGNDIESDDKKIETFSISIDDTKIPDINDYSKELKYKNSSIHKVKDTIFYEDFEGVWPGEWVCFDDDSRNGEDFWGDNNYRAYAGGWSGYCADVSDVPGQYYDNYMWAQMNRVVDLTEYSSVTLSYFYWVDSEAGYDYLQVGYYDGIWPNGDWVRPSSNSYSGDSGGWVLDTLDVPTTATIIGFLFESDILITGEGAYVDEIYLTGVPSPPPPAPTLISPGSGSPPGLMIYTVLPTFYWTNVPNADYYGLYISEYPYGPSNLVFDSEVNYGPIYGNQFTLPISYILTSDERFAWNMRSHNSNGWGPFSSSLFFQTPPVYEITFQDVPTNGGTITFNTITYSHGQVTYVFPQTFTIAANPASGYEFVHWSSTCGTVEDPNSASTTITVSSSGILKAWFTQDVTPPDVQTNDASNVGDTYATLHGQILNDGGESCQIRFRYREYGSGTWTYPLDWHGSYNSGQTFSESIGGLSPGTTYEFEAGAKNTVGETWGTTKLFTTGTPELSYYPTELDFGTHEQGWTGSQTFEIWNSGGGILTYTLSESCSWVDVNPTNGDSTGEHDTITVSIDTTDLSEGSHNCAILISSNGGSGVLTVYINVIPSGTPVLSYSPTSHDFGSMWEGEMASATFEIWNSGDGTLTYSLSESCNWVAVIPLNGDSNGPSDVDTITVIIYTNGLADGTHNCDIYINSNGGSGTYSVSVNSWKPFYFVHITDPHVTANRFDVWEEDIQKIRDMNLLPYNAPPDFVLCTGDLVDLGTPANYEALLNLDTILYGEKPFFYIDSGENIPIYFCPGNHDERLRTDFSKYYDKIGPDYLSVSHKNCAIFSLNSGKDSIFFDLLSPFPPEGDGINDDYTNELTDFYNDVVSNSNEEIKIVMLHHPYEANDDPDNLDGEFIDGRDDFIDICNYDIDMVFCGHLHEVDEGDGTLKIGDDTDQVNTRSIAGKGGNYYRIIHVDPIKYPKGYEIDSMEAFSSIISGDIYSVNMENSMTTVDIIDEQGNHNGPIWRGEIETQIPMSTYSFWELQNDTLGINTTYTEFMLDKNDTKNYTIIIKGLSDDSMNVTFFTSLVGGDWIESKYVNVTMYNGSIATVYANESIINYSMVIVDPNRATRVVNPSSIEENLPPELISTPIGPTVTSPEEVCNYSITAIDPNSDNVYYWFEWGDGTNSSWIGPYHSNETCIANHSWNMNGTYEIRVKTKDDYSLEGNWSQGLAVNIQLQTDDWNMFRHDAQHTGYSASTAPETNNVLWNYTTGDDVVSSPAVVDGRVYITSTDENVYCLNGSTGDFVWSFSSAYTLSVSSVAVYDDRVYVGTGYKVYCLDATTGSHIWNQSAIRPNFCSPTVADNKIYIGSELGEIYCLNALTGDHVWNFSIATNRGYSTPAVYNNRVYVGSSEGSDGKIYCLDALNGNHIWNHSIGFVVSSPTLFNGNVYVGSYDHNVYCLDALTGSLKWNYTTGSCVSSSPALAYGNVYVGGEDNNVYCIDATNGSLKWSYTTNNLVFSSPAVADGKVYVTSYGGTLYCLNAYTGHHIWNYTTGGIFLWCSPAVADRNVYVGSADNKVYCFGNYIAPDTVYVDDNYNASTPGWENDHFDSIQDGIDAVAENGTVYVYNGMYYENVVANKTINLIGEDRNNTIIDGNNSEDVVYISADWVSISGFTIQNSGYSGYPNRDAGIDIRYSNYNIITGNNISNNYWGLNLSYSNNNTITDNIISNNYHIYISYSNNNTINGNNISKNEEGIDFRYSCNNNIIAGNTITSNRLDEGIRFDYSCNSNTISGNTVSNNSFGIGLYWSCNNNIIAGNTITSNNYWGIILGGSCNNTISGNNLTLNNGESIYLYSTSSYNNIIGNNILNNLYGILLSSFSNDNTIKNNNISNNYMGINIGDSDNNTLSGNTLSNNQKGISFFSSPVSNIIYNNFFNNTDNVYGDGSNNIWNISKIPGTNIISGQYLGGNYWSDYTGMDTDGDGLGDTDLPYNCSGEIQNGGDWLPLTNLSLATSSIVVHKEAIPDDSQVFIFTSNTLTPSTFYLDDDGDNTNNYSNNTSFIGLSEGIYDISETVPSGWDLYTITITDPSGGSSSSGNTAYIDLAAGETVTVIFGNTKHGMIIVDKVTDPSGDPQEFEFSPDWGSNFFLADGDTPYNSGDLSPGIYEVSEINIPSGWSLISIVITDPSGGSSSSGNTAYIELAPGETVTVTFTNFYNEPPEQTIEIGTPVIEDVYWTGFEWLSLIGANTPVWINSTDSSPGTHYIKYRLFWGTEYGVWEDPNPDWIYVYDNQQSSDPGLNDTDPAVGSISIRLTFNTSCFHQIHAHCYDLLGNVNYSDPLDFMVDADGPENDEYEYIGPMYKLEGDEKYINCQTVKRIYANDTGCSGGIAGVCNIHWSVENYQSVLLSEGDVYDNDETEYEDEHVYVTGDLDLTVGKIVIEISIKEDCKHFIYHQAFDCLENKKVGVKQEVLVDCKPPEIIKTHPDHGYYPIPDTDPHEGYLKAGEKIILEAEDNLNPWPCNSGLQALFYRYEWDGQYYPDGAGPGVQSGAELAAIYGYTNPEIINYWWYRIDGGYAEITFNEECKHDLYYWAKDNVTNHGEVHHQIYYVDDSNPYVEITYPDHGYYPNDYQYLKAGVSITLDAYDLPDNDCMAGMESIFWRYEWDGSYFPSGPGTGVVSGAELASWYGYTDPEILDYYWYFVNENTVDISFPEECQHEFYYWAKDNVCHPSTIYHKTFYVDDSKPDVSSEIEGPYCYEENGIYYINDQSKIWINTTDLPENECAAGIESIFWRYENITGEHPYAGEPGAYSGAVIAATYGYNDPDIINYWWYVVNDTSIFVQFLNEGQHDLYYWTKDNVYHHTEIFNKTFYIDMTIPVITNCTHQPDLQVIGGWLNISCDITDECGVDIAKVNITYPDNSSFETTLLEGSYYYNTTYSQSGIYYYYIIAIDQLGNINTSAVYQFTILSVYNLSLCAGWNLITVPFENTLWANTLAENISGCQMVSWFDCTNQTYETYIVGGPPQFDFPILNGYGYFILVTESSYFNISGLPLDNVSWTLCTGWNLIGWYQTFDTIASSLAGNISDCSMISWFDCNNQTYETYIVGGPPQFDFVISPGMGVFVLIDAYKTNDKPYVVPGLPMNGFVDGNKNIKVEGNKKVIKI